MEDFLKKIIENGDIEKDIANLQIESNYKLYNDISKSISFMKLGLDRLKKIYTRMEIYEDIIKINKTPGDPWMYIQLDRNAIDKLQRRVQQFRNKRGRGYLIIYLGLFYPVGGHATVLFIDRNRGKITMERYDPGYTINAEQGVVDEYMNVLATHLNMTYIPASFACTVLGPQSLYNDTFGYCQTHVLQYIKDRMMFIYSNQIEVVSNTIKKLTDKQTFIKELDDTIKDTMRYIFSTYKISPEVRELIVNYNNIDVRWKLFVDSYLIGLRK